VIGSSLQQVHQGSVNVGFSYDVLTDLLIHKGIITKSELNETATKFQTKQKKFMELVSDSKLTPEEKNAIAAEHGIEVDFTKLNGE
jgi:hypothetical protein